MVLRRRRKKHTETPSLEMDIIAAFMDHFNSFEDVFTLV